MLNSRDLPGPAAARSLPALAVLGLALILAPALATSALAGGVRPGGGGFGTGTTSPPTGETEAFRFHVLSRATYGVTPQSLAQIRAVGAEEFLSRQLDPAGIEDGDMDARMLAEVQPWTVDCHLPDGMDPEERCYRWNHLYYEHLLRARHSQRQLQELMVQFWENHFDTVVVRGNNEDEQHLWTKMEYVEYQGFRANALGYFRDLLEISAKSQAMMYFLDNFRSSVFTLNENYARELLELHSVGVDCGYNQTDVIEVARIFTGWTGVDLPGAPPDLRRDVIEGDFLFRAAAHDATQKWRAGSDGLLVPPGSWPAGGMLDEGEAILDLIARHPCTARFISSKLLQTFVEDYPSDEFVDRIAHVFLTTDGHIQSVLEAIFASPEFRDPQKFENKVQTPLEYTIAALRATDAHVGPRRDTGESSHRELYNWIRLQGMDLFEYPIPTGYYEDGGEWISGNGFLQRWRFAETLTRWFNNASRTTYIDPLATVNAHGLQAPEAIVDHFATLIVGPGLSAERRQALLDILTNGTGVWGGSENDLRQMISHLLGSPEFMQQ